MELRLNITSGAEVTLTFHDRDLLMPLTQTALDVPILRYELKDTLNRGYALDLSLRKTQRVFISTPEHR